MTARDMSASRSESETRVAEVHLLSSDCRNTFHSFCSGRRYVGMDKHGRLDYARCQCSCHRALSPFPPTPEQEGE